MEELKGFLRNESGLETIEWAFILGLVVLVAVMALIGARKSLIDIFGELKTELASAADWSDVPTQ